MRHLKAHRKLGRTTSHRKALLKNLSIALITAGKIETTTPKAKELQSYIEKLVTRARKGDFNAHRAIFSALQEKVATHKLVTEIAPKYADRKGGYVRIQKSGTRLGDAAPLAIISFVE
jgi:large subunit ribosomal protein L17